MSVEKVEEMFQRKATGKYPKVQNRLTATEQKFVDEYVQDFDVKRAIIATVLETHPNSKKYDYMMHKMRVRVAIAKEREKLKKEYNLTPERTIQEYVSIAMANVRDVFSWEEDGEIKMKAVEDLTPEQTAAIAEIQIRHDYKEKKDYISKIKFHNKNTALEALSKHLGIFEKDNRQKAQASADVVNKLLDIIGRENKELAIALKQELVKEMHEDSMSIN